MLNYGVALSAYVSQHIIIKHKAFKKFPLKTHPLYVPSRFSSWINHLVCSVAHALHGRCVCVCTYIHTYIHTYIYTHTYTYEYINIKKKYCTKLNTCKVVFSICLKGVCLLNHIHMYTFLVCIMSLSCVQAKVQCTLT